MQVPARAAVRGLHDPTRAEQAGCVGLPLAPGGHRRPAVTHGVPQVRERCPAWWRTVRVTMSALAPSRRTIAITVASSSARRAAIRAMHTGQLHGLPQVRNPL